MLKNLLFALSLLFSTSSAVAEPAPSSAPLYAASFIGLDGRQLDLAQLRGKVAVVNFWATWCPPCLKEMPDLVRAYKEYKNQDIVFLGIAVDDNTKQVQKFARDHAITFPLAIGKERGIMLMQALGNNMAGLPYTLVLDSQGNIVASKLGPISPDHLKQVLQQAINTSSTKKN